MKRFLALLLTLTLLLCVTACGNNADTNTNPNQPAAGQNPSGDSDTDQDSSGAFPFTLTTKDGAEVTFTHVPERVLVTNVNPGDQLMALGLGDKIIGTGWNNTEVAEAFRAEYEAKPVVFETSPSLETILDLEPDFVYGRSSSFTEKLGTTHDTLSNYGISSLSNIESYKLGADLEDVYQDFYNLGRIFQVEDRAEELVNTMKERIAQVQDAIQGTEPVKVFVYDKERDGGAYTCGNNFTATLIEYGGGENIFKDMEETWQVVSWEEVVDRNPDVIVINDYGDIPLEQKISELMDNPIMSTVTAVQENNIISISLCESFASSQTADTIEKFAQAFHPDCF